MIYGEAAADLVRMLVRRVYDGRNADLPTIAALIGRPDSYGLDTASGIEQRLETLRDIVEHFILGSSPDAVARRKTLMDEVFPHPVRDDPLEPSSEQQMVARADFVRDMLETVDAGRRFETAREGNRFVAIVPPEDRSELGRAQIRIEMRLRDVAQLNGVMAVEFRDGAAFALGTGELLVRRPWTIDFGQPADDVKAQAVRALRESVSIFDDFEDCLDEMEPILPSPERSRDAHRVYKTQDGAPAS